MDRVQVKDKIESWHRRLCAVAGGLSLTLTRGKGVKKSDLVKWTDVLSEVEREMDAVSRR